jgi:hypothetical protein
VKQAIGAKTRGDTNELSLKMLIKEAEDEFFEDQ